VHSYLPATKCHYCDALLKHMLAVSLDVPAADIVLAMTPACTSTLVAAYLC
jgi:hypothetical protein